MLKRTLVLISFCLLYFFSSGQKAKDSIPLFLFLQENFDTTIILDTYSTWGHSPHYQIISIKNNEFYPFTYLNPFTFYKGRGLPKSLQTKFSAQNSKLQFSLPDTNAYFLPKYFTYPEEPGIRKTIRELSLWTLPDDIKEGEGCGTDCYTFDSVEYDIWLITNKEIRKLHFYDPEYFEKCCPVRKGRQTAIQLIKIMNTYIH